jgi:hypothetical protein
VRSAKFDGGAWSRHHQPGRSIADNRGEADAVEIDNQGLT